MIRKPVKKSKKKKNSKKKNTITPAPIVHLSSFSISNFKPFGESIRSGSIHKEPDLTKFAPLTFILGKNSSGKSSIIQSLNLLSQSYKDTEGLKTLRGRGKLSNLGAFDAYVHNQNKKEKLTYSLTLDEHFTKKQQLNHHGYQFSFSDNNNNQAQLRKSAYYKDFNQPELGSKPNGGLAFDHHYMHSSDKQKRKESACKIDISCLEDKEFPNPTVDELLNLIKSSYLKTTRKKITNKKIKNIFKHWEISTNKAGFPLQLGVPLSPDKKAIDKLIKNLRSNIQPFVETDRALKNIIDKLRNPLRAFFDRYEYIGPSRDVPTRTQVKQTSNAISVGVSGEQATDILLDNEDTILNTMNGILDILKVPYEIAIRNYSDIKIESTYSIVLKDKRSNVTVSTYDVGFGIFQFIPVIVQGLFPSRNIITCEQPEIHLHPALVADLADFFIETSNLSIEKRIFDLPDEFIDSKKFIFGNQWIIETHSELLIRRVLKRIREGKIKKTDVSVLYVEPSTSKNKSAQILELRIDDDGEFIDRWPDGFFDEALNEL
tara:strand:+ start:3353 stop:4987 length:1635 start_codon:yes stop_codon:yes gene_type:complete